MLKVMTMNIGFYGEKRGSWSARREIIQRVIAESQPDIVALQAVASDPLVEGGGLAEQASNIETVAADQDENGARPSDHAGLLVTLSRAR